MGGSTFIGRVVSNRMQKTVVVAVNYVVWVPKYQVYEKRMGRHMAHDEKQECVVGDVVKIQVGRKRSKHKSYRVSDILRRTPVLSSQPAAGTSTPPLSAVEVAEQRLAAARERLAAVQRMYKRELGVQSLSAPLAAAQHQGSQQEAQAQLLPETPEPAAAASHAAETLHAGSDAGGNSSASHKQGSGSDTGVMS